MNQFDVIMKQYRAKISDFSYKLDKEFEELVDIGMVQNQIIDINSKIKNVGFEKVREFGGGLLKPMLKRDKER